MNTSSFSTEKLLRLAFNHCLVSDYTMTSHKIELQIDGSRLCFDPEEARFFLRGLLQGFQERRIQAGLVIPAPARAAA